MAPAKSRRGRPPSKSPRTALLTIRVTPPELARLNEVAEAREASVAELLRPAIDRILRSSLATE